MFLKWFSFILIIQGDSGLSVLFLFVRANSLWTWEAFARRTEQRVSLDVGSQVSRVMVWLKALRAVLHFLQGQSHCVWWWPSWSYVCRAWRLRFLSPGQSAHVCTRGENDRAVDERDLWLDAGLLFISLGPLTQRGYFINVHFLFRMLLKPRLETHSLILCHIISGGYCL